MFYEQSKQDIKEDLIYSIDHHYHQKKILLFLQKQLPETTNKLIKGTLFSLSVANEDNITREICNILNDELRNSSGYLFRFEAKIGPDILIFASPYKPFSNPLFVIEAKRLPPTSRQDYVLTGIRRFKIEEHGAQHDIAAMLGYVQEFNFDHWYKDVNSWIDIKIYKRDEEKVIWTQKDKVNVIQITDIGEYISIHSRVRRKPIKLYHFWLNFCPN